MAKKDLSNLDRDIMQPISRDIDDAFSDGIDCDVKIMGGNALKLYAADDTTYNSLYTDVSGNLVIPAESATTYNDDVSLSFGSDSDTSLTWVSLSSHLYLSTIADGTDLVIGNGTLSLDVLWYGSSSGNLVTFSSTGDDVTFTGVDLSLEDDDHLYLGSANDIDISWDAVELNIIPLTDHSDIILGSTAGDKSFDIDIYGADDSHFIKWASASSELDITGTVEMQSTNKVQFSSSGNYIQASTGSQLDIVADTTLALSGAVTMDSTVSMDGIVTMGSYVALHGTTGSSTGTGYIWYNTDTNKLNFYNGSEVEVVTST